eukprot:802921-Heterocapsa_arctica.AAC.1
MQGAQGETRRIWKQFLQELLEKEVASDMKGAGKGGSNNAGLQEGVKELRKREEKASGSADTPIFQDAFRS